MERVTELSQERMILVGANDPLPDDHFWFDGEGFSVYAAKQPRSTWHEHVHDCVQVTVGLEPAHMHAEWRATGRLRQSKEFIGNAVTVIPGRVPHKTLWQRRAALIHIYIREEFLRRLALDVLQQDFLELQPTYLVRDLLIEELARSLYLESESGHLNASEERQRATHRDLDAVWLLQPEPVHHILSQAGRNDAGAFPLITHRFSVLASVSRQPPCPPRKEQPEESRITRSSRKLSGLPFYHTVNKRDG